MSLPKSEISEILYTMSDILTRLIDRIENDTEFQPFERRELLNTLYKQMCGIQIDEILTHADSKHKLQIKRGDTDKNAAYIGRPGELTMDTETNTVHLHDGKTTGGVAMARATDVIGDWVVESQLPTAENNYTWYRKYKSGWVEIGGYAASGGQKTYIQIDLPFAMPTDKYNVFVSLISGSTALRSGHLNDITCNGFKYGWVNGTSAVDFSMYWFISGQVS